jgi:hypothetical protein
MSLRSSGLRLLTADDIDAAQTFVTGYLADEDIVHG